MNTKVLFKLLLIILMSLNVETIFGQNIFINEFLASNVTVSPEIADFSDYPDWLELYNAKDTPFDLGGYYLTDNFDEPNKWQIPAGTVVAAKGFIRFWADGMDDVPGNTLRWYHLNFKLSQAGEEIGLFSPNQTPVDTISFGLQTPDVSYGRQPDGAENWFYFGEPTPDSANTTEGVLTTDKASTPNFSVPGGFYGAGQIVNITKDSTNSTIRYWKVWSRLSSIGKENRSKIILKSTKDLRDNLLEQDK